MRLQGLFFFGIGIITAFGSVARADCFDFSQPIKKGAENSAKVVLKSDRGMEDASGTLPSGVIWGEARGEVGLSISAILSELVSHELTKAGRVSEMQLKTIDDPKFLFRQKAHFVVKPFLFISVEWTEDWAATLLEGTREAPKRAIVAFEKTEGTSHIHHLCGDYELDSVGPSQTRVTIYEEARATSRTEPDTLNGVRRTMERLRERAGGHGQ